MSLTGDQLRDVRAILGLSQVAFAVQFEVGVRAIAEFEDGKPTLSAARLQAIRRGLEAAGFEFPGGKPSVKFGRC